ncbi:MAG: CYTH domain-containing protein [bacterium]
MLEAEVIFLIKENVYYRHIYQDLAESFSLPAIQEHLKPVRVLDRYFDTDDFQFLKAGSSFRVRERRFLSGRDSQGRLAIKTLSPENEKTKLTLLREERRLILEGWHLNKINEFFEMFGGMVIKKPLYAIIAVEELSEEIQLGQGEEHFHMSFDKVTYIDEETYNHHTEYILEVEGHGVPVAMLEEIGGYMLEKWPLEHTKRNKYQRGMTLLELI